MEDGTHVPDERDPRTAGDAKPCYSSHSAGPWLANQYAMWRKCSKCALRLEYHPHRQAAGQYRSAGPLPGVVTRALQLGNSLPDHLWTSKQVEAWIAQAQAEKRVRQPAKKAATATEDADMFDSTSGPPPGPTGPSGASGSSGPSPSTGPDSTAQGPQPPAPPPAGSTSNRKGPGPQPKEARHKTLQPDPISPELATDTLEFEIVGDSDGDSEEIVWVTPPEEPQEKAPPKNHPKEKTPTKDVAKKIQVEIVPTEMQAGSSSSPPRTAKEQELKADVVRRIQFDYAAASF